MRDVADPARELGGHGDDLLEGGGAHQGQAAPDKGEVQTEVVLGCWNPMAQWGSFKAQQKLHFKAVFHAVH